MTRNHTRALSLSALALTGALALTACGSGESDAELGTEGNPVQLGVVGASEPYWTTFEEAVEAEGIQLDIVDFTEYTQPNPALSEGELDINQFQHIQYLADYNVSAGDDIQPIGATAIYPMGLYSEKYDSVDQIQEGETVIVPNDTVNQARGLLVLQSAGLITLQDGGNASSTPEDIIEEESKVEVSALDAAVTVTSLPDVAAAIVNNDFMGDAGLTPEDAIAQDDPEDPAALPYVNIFATKAEDKDNEVLNKLVEIYQTNQDVLDGAQESAGGSAVFLQTPAAELQESLTTTEEALSNAG
ncbi:ABC transporter substrate-binding protein [Citricoccus zhacaiensis]|uniref:MetQ/NlpA family ABC transporter substrate-binding protein n=2 Tax=Citricoccus TaxID=169133 RepID=A0ABV0II89_9MICC|nr:MULTISPECIES: MetQ/NlpA family ABC transporter substrate-binding protein [Citricoccus]WMY79138.1 MetQ/NlpA family ABC transporter substrate-binding protein [Citricoccus sp. I39-566]GGO49456.1 ABC transporter substrate-binding protein [Citricoccus zhacaiensis]